MAALLLLFAFLLAGYWRTEIILFSRLRFAHQPGISRLAGFSSSRQQPVSLGAGASAHDRFFQLSLRFRPERSPWPHPNVFQTAPGNAGIRMELAEDGAPSVLFSDTTGKLREASCDSCPLGVWHRVSITAINDQYIKVHFDHETPYVSRADIPRFDLSDIKIGEGFSSERKFSGELAHIHMRNGKPRHERFGQQVYWALRALLFTAFAVCAFLSRKGWFASRPIPEPPASAKPGWHASGTALVASIAAVKLIVHLLLAPRYGYFSDELYMIACSRHLHWGYVDQPPLIALLTRLSLTLTGKSLLSLRLTAALAGTALVLLVGWMTRRLGGGRFAQTLAAIAVLASPVYLTYQYVMTMNAFEPLFWMGCAGFVLLAIQENQPRYWFGFGLLAGLGLENKYSIAVFCFGLLLGLLLTPERRLLTSRYFAAAAGLAFLIFLPNLLWLVYNRFPFLQFQHAIRNGVSYLALGELTFLIHEAWLTGLAWVVALAGLWFFFRSEPGRRYRALGWAAVITLLAFILLHGKDYYPTPAYGILFAGGALTIERFTQHRRTWLRPAAIVSILAVGAFFAPTFVPVLPFEQEQAYQKYFGLYGPFSDARQYDPKGPSPMFTAQFDTEAMTAFVSRVYFQLPPATRAKTAILASEYVRAGAIDFFGPKYGLPNAISGHMSYYLWGPRHYTGESVITIGFPTGDPLVRLCHDPGMGPQPRWGVVLLCPNGLGFNLQEHWSTLKWWVN